MQELNPSRVTEPTGVTHLESLVPPSRRLDPRDPLGLAPDAPLLAAYLECLDRFGAGEAPFQTPGHKGSTALTGVTVAGDHPLAGGLDTVKLSHGTLLEAERRAAAAWGATFCRFSTGGSTHCNQALAMSVGAPGDEVVVARTLHRSLLLGLVLAGLEPVWVEPQVSPTTGLALGYEPEAVASALRAHPRARAVFLTDPSYVGTCSDLAAHVDVAHAAGVPLIVDMAWAAHFGFHPALPPHALGAGADAMVTSAHKTLPAYCQGALLLARTERLDPSRLTRAFEALATTSPAGTILASIDASRALLVRDGEALLGRTLATVARARARLREIDGLEVLDGPLVDPVKLTVSLAGTGAHGVAIEQDLADAGVPVELADRDTIVALVTLADEPAAIERLTDALVDAIARRRGAPRTIAGAAGWIVSPRPKVSPRAAFFGAVETVPFARAAGRVSAELIALYPPGVPVLAPGEEITERALASLAEAAEDGVRVAYAIDPTLATLQVLA
jgi:lysine decarboxylase